MTRVHARLVTFVACSLVALPLVSISPQTPPTRVQYPATRTVEHVDTYNGTKVADPYRWLEAIDSTGVADWVRAQNAVTMPYLAALPGRDLLKQRITALYDFPRTSVPFWEGSRWFYISGRSLRDVLSFEESRVWTAQSCWDLSFLDAAPPNKR